MAEHVAPIVRLWHYAAPHRGRVALATVLSMLNKVMDIAPEILIGVAVDVVVRQQDSWLASVGVTDPRDQIVVLSVLTFVVWALESVFEYAYGVAWRNLAQTVQHELRVDTYRRVQDLELAYFEDRSTGGLMAVMNDDVNQLERFLDTGANDIIQTVTGVVGVSVVFFILSPTIAVLAVLPIPIIVWGSIRFTRRMGPRYAAVREQAGRINGVLANNLGGIATIKSFTAEDRETARIAGESDRYRQVNRSAIRLSSAFVPLIRVAILAGFLVTLVYGGFRVLDGTLEVGAYSILVFLTQRLLWPLTRLGETLDLYQRAMASTNRILDVFDTEPAMSDGDAELPAGSIRGEVLFDDVTFAYGGGPPVLRGVTIEIPAGHTVAVVGPTGAGKTTIVKLLLRFADVDGGAVLLDRCDVRSLRLADLRRAIGLVSQDVFLFDGTVADNIAYGRPEATREEIEGAAALAEAAGFIADLPAGYQTVVGERGQKLSGGQRQRISIARAILSDPEVLVLDEATSAVDNETEAAIQRSLERVSRDRTTLVIAHRLSTIRHADRIYVLDSGVVKESGTHDELVAAGGIYAGLWAVQTGAAIPWHETPLTGT
ncbi:MAG: ABC transporter ATP-binding protein [Acidimicrobiia bacterium]